MPPTVTDRSCIASRSADWVFGVARLISSARTICAKIGPRRNWNSRPRSVSTTIVVPVTSAGMRSGVNWIRENFRCSASESERIRSVLPSPGTPSSSTWPPAKRPTSTPSTTSRCPTTALPISPRTFAKSSRNRTAAASMAAIESADGFTASAPGGGTLAHGSRASPEDRTRPDQQEDRRGPRKEPRRRR